MPYTDSVEVCAQAVHDRILANQAGLGIHSLYYGDQAKIPHTPTVCVEPGSHRSDMNGVGLRGRVANTFEVFVLVYSMEINTMTNNLKISDSLAYSVRTLLHSEVQFGGIVHQSYVTLMEPGYVQRPSLIRACRITWQGLSQTFV